MRQADEQEFEISTDKSRLDLDIIHRFLSEESYWANKRSLERSKTAIENSICFGVYHHGRQIGFARVVSDKATFAYIGDVFILDEFRGRGLSKKLMKSMLEHPELQGLRRWVLATRDAHGLYEQFGFSLMKFPERWMELPAKDAY
jgi:N-acetylglutamate synthase-like GNAT family acetyltransferase